MPKYKFVFVVRKFNDLDNMLPLIDKCISSHQNVRIVSLRPEILNNFLARYINKEYKIFIEYPTLHSKKLIIRFLSRITIFIRFLIDSYEMKVNMKYIRFFLKKINRLIISDSYFSSEIENKIFNHIKPDVVIFDTTNITKGRIYKDVVKYLTSMNIPIIRLEHGVDPLVRDKNYIPSHLDNTRGFDYRKMYDFFAFEPSSKKFYDSRFLIGSLRYSIEWVEKYSNIYDYDLFEKFIKKSKTIVILLSADHIIKSQEVAQLIKHISNKFNFDILLKPHTRNNVIDHNIIASLDNPDRVRFVYNSTAWLIDNSDVTVICGCTSVGLHAVINRKPLIVAEYTKTPKETSYYSKFNSACIANNSNEVLLHIDNVLNKDISCYDERNVEKFLGFMANPNNSNSVIDDHYNLIIKIINNEI